MCIRLTILGSASATPTPQNFPTAQLLQICDRYILIDCGEGAQLQLRKAGIAFSKIDQVYISHLHGDHFFGLPGLLASLQLLQRKRPLQVFAPKGTEAIMATIFKETGTRLSYPLQIAELTTNTSEVIYADDKIEVRNLPLDHRIYTNGYLFKEKPKLRKLDRAAVEKYPEIQIRDYSNLKNGCDFIRKDGTRIKNEWVTQDPPNPLSYAFCSDTAYKPELAGLLKNVSALYHEATFLENDAHLARQTKHSTAIEAAQLALASRAGLLLLGHFSARYKEWNAFQREAETQFKPVRLVRSGEVLEITRGNPKIAVS